MEKLSLFSGQLNNDNLSIPMTRELPAHGLCKQLYRREVGGSCDPMSATGCERGDPDLVNLAQVRVVYLKHDHNFLRIQRVPLHSGERDFHLNEFAVRGNRAAADGK